MNRKFKITIDVEYNSDVYPDPSNLLDSFQDNAKDLLEPYGETVENFEVCVEDVD